MAAAAQGLAQAEIGVNVAGRAGTDEYVVHGPPRPVTPPEQRPRERGLSSAVAAEKIMPVAQRTPAGASAVKLGSWGVKLGGRGGGRTQV